MNVTPAARMPSSGAASPEVRVSADEDGMRLDRWLRTRDPALGFGAAHRLVRTGRVRVDGATVSAGARLRTGQRVRAPRPTGSASLLPRVLYADDSLLVLDKPRGLAVQGGPGRGPVLHEVLHQVLDGVRVLEGLRDEVLGRLGDGPIGARPRRLHLVHRLDRETSGCLVLATSPRAARALGEAFRARAVRKTYWALVARPPRSAHGTVDTHLVRRHRQGSGLRVEVTGPGPGTRRAVTHHRLLQTSEAGSAWLELTPVTGRTHQVRVHAAHLGSPVLGDPVYGAGAGAGGPARGLQLLARRIVVPHPRTGHPVTVTAPLPPHMRRAVAELGLDPAEDR